MNISDEIVNSKESLTERDDVDDNDYSSITSEASRNEEQLRSVVTKTLQEINTEFEDDKYDLSSFKSTTASVSDILAIENTSNNAEHNQGEFITSISSVSDQPTLKSEQSIHDTQAEEDQSSAIGTFYIADESESEETKPNTLSEHIEIEGNQSKSSDDQPIFSNTDRQSISNTYDQVSEEQQTENEIISKSSAEMALGSTPISELPDHNYELHNIKFIQPIESVPLGFTLSKQTDSSQCVVIGIDQQSKAEIAGLKTDDWLIKVDDNDIRTSELSDILQNIDRILDTVGYVSILVARKKTITPEPVITDRQTSILATYDKPNETNALLSVGLSNKIDDQNVYQSTQEDYASLPSDDQEKIRHIILKEALGLDFYSFAPDKTSQIKIHAISNVRPLSLAYRAGLRNGDRILTVNNIDVTNTTHKNVRHRLLKKSPVHLTVINESQYLELIETIQRDQNRITLSASLSSVSSSSYELLGQQPSPNLLSEDLINVLFIDDIGPVYMKHCILKKETIYDSLGFQLRYIDNCHIIDDIDMNMPAYNCGLRNEDVILYVNKQNVEQMTHDDVKILIRTLLFTSEIFNLILLKKNDMERFKNYQKKSFIDWKSIIADIHEDEIHQVQSRVSYVNQPSNATITSSSLPPGARICILEPSVGRSAGFSINGEEKSPFIITKIDQDSPAERAGLQLYDAILSVNGKSVVQTTYDEVIQIIKQSLQQKTVQIIVNQVSISQRPEQRHSSQSSTSDSNDSSDEEITTDGNRSEETSQRDANSVRLYQRQRSRELAYTLRLCHLNTTNSDGEPASTFGFDITKEPKYEYPMISRVEPKLPGERSGLQTRDLLLKVNGRKTKGVVLDKIKQTIEKAKSDNRLELLVVDEQVYRYCKSTKRKFKEPFIKVKHIFPKSRSSINFQSLDSIAAKASVTSQDIIDQLTNGAAFKVHRLSISTEPAIDNDDDALSSPISEETVDFDTSSPINSSEKLQKQTSTDGSIVDSVLNTINNIFQTTESKNSIQLDYDIPSEQAMDAKTHAPLLSTVHFDQNVSEEIREISRLYHTVCSNRSSGIYDYIRDPRRCVLKIDRNKGLGFVLSATGDYDHTITTVEKNSIADVAGLQVDDELLEINNLDVRNIKYEQVVEMLFSAIRTDNTIEICVTNSRSNDFYPPTIDTNRIANTHDNHVDHNLIIRTVPTDVLTDDVSYRKSPSNSLKQLTIDTNHRSLYNHSKHLNNHTDLSRNGHVPTISTGITASPKSLRLENSPSTSSKKNAKTKILNISKKDAPVARLCRIRKFPSSPFYGFFLCGNPKRLGRVHVSNIKKNSSAAICGLRNGDYIIEVNGINIQTFTYETILNRIQLHMETS